MAMMITIAIIMLLLLLLFILLLACRPWRFFSSSFLPQSNLQVDQDLERPLMQDDYGQPLTQRNEPLIDHIPERTCIQVDGNLNLLGADDHAYKQGSPSSSTHDIEGDSHLVNIYDQSEDITVGQTLKSLFPRSHIEEVKHTNDDSNDDSRFREDNVKFQVSLSLNIPEIVRSAGSCLKLEVINGPACGRCFSVKSTDTAKLPLTLGRVPPCDLALKDSEVSGKHATINWNSNKLKWELVDMGSLNGTRLNGRAVHHPDIGSRNWSEPTELVAGDVITLGTTSQINVQITSVTEPEIPFGVGMASDPMSMRRGGKKLPMEDVCFYNWPLAGADQFAVFGICDGHGGSLACQSVSKMLPEMVAAILSDSSRKEKVLSQQDASDVLMDALSQTEAYLNHYYEGCTATILLVWVVGRETLFVQCANVGDSACVLNIDGKQIKMTEDHRITSSLERQRINETGDPLKDGDTRLCGLNLGRMLGDKFLKEQDARFSSMPYISQVFRIEQGSEAFALLASDGLWDVISVKKADMLILQAKERYSAERKDFAEKIANMLVNEARTLHTKDNTSVVYVDFDVLLRSMYKYDS